LQTGIEKGKPLPSASTSHCSSSSLSSSSSSRTVLSSTLPLISDRQEVPEHFWTFVLHPKGLIQSFPLHPARFTHGPPFLSHPRGLPQGGEFSLLPLFLPQRSPTHPQPLPEQSGEGLLFTEEFGGLGGRSGNLRGSGRNITNGRSICGAAPQPDC
jgi:hypothetical protein